jgi:hypothetical protein
LCLCIYGAKQKNDGGKKKTPQELIKIATICYYLIH